MSARAEELAFEIWDLSTDTREWPEYRDIVTARIDAELRKERDEAADRAIVFESNFVKNLDPVITSAYMQDLRAAIRAAQDATSAEGKG